MKSRSLLLTLVLFTWAVVSASFAGPRGAQWKQVDEATGKGLPKTAIESLDPIIQDAVAEKAYPEAIKAIGRKIGLQGKIEGSKTEEQIVRMETELAKAPAPMKPMM